MAPLPYDLTKFAKELFKSAQKPSAWLASADRLRDAAEAILQHELPNEVPYFTAYAEAEQAAAAQEYSDGEDSGHAEIKAMPPNYPPAQLLYAYAIENVLKGLILANTPGLVEEYKLNSEVTSHDLITLAARACVAVHVQEKPVLEALSHLSIWAGRYPVARSRREYTGAPNSDEFLDFGSAHPIMRCFFERARKELEPRSGPQIGSQFGSVVVWRQPGT